MSSDQVVHDIYGVLREMNDNIAKLTIGQALLSQNQETVVMPCLKLLNEKVVTGNGHPPLCMTVDNHETRLTTLETCQETRKTDSFRRIDIWIAVGMLVCAMGEIYILARHTS